MRKQDVIITKKSVNRNGSIWCAWVCVCVCSCVHCILHCVHNIVHITHAGTTIAAWKSPHIKAKITIHFNGNGVINNTQNHIVVDDGGYRLLFWKEEIWAKWKRRAHKRERKYVQVSMVKSSRQINITKYIHRPKILSVFGACMLSGLVVLCVCVCLYAYSHSFMYS